jgi:AraC family L-rhamnose operon transcriptional activator RhaR/AraC family L-rhamnose operon regulatory protein RhaS
MARRIIGRAIETVGAVERVQACTGTYRGDLPDPRLRFNILFVRHDEPFPLHGHEYSELVIVLGGRSGHRTDVEDFPIAAGDVFVINRPHRHAFLDPERLELCNVQFDPKVMFAGQRDLGTMMGFHALFDLEPRWRQSVRFRQRLRLTPAQLQSVKGRLRAIEREFRGDTEGRATAVRSLFLLLATDLARYYGEARRKRPTPVARLAAALAYARRHLSKPLRMDTLAKISQLSPSQFQRAFRKAYGVPPVRKINEFRIEEARAYLEDPSRDIAGVARDTGFASASFFSTQFKRFTGLTPREYRRTVLR